MTKLAKAALFICALALLGLIPAVKLLSTTPAPEQPSLGTLPTPTLTVVTPSATIPAGTVNVSVAVTNFTLTLPGGINVPGQGHLHYYLDVVIPTTPGLPAVTPVGTYQATPGTTAVWNNVLPGQHTFGAQLVNNDHTPLSPPVTATVTVNVVPGP
ncbi:MAG: DUF4399 domain-containing protein [Chloroflexi bacterium]|nr:DUF4399 domain-containing protein [Chloroflexota bacterium]